MKKLHIFIYFLTIIIPSAVHTRLIEIIATNGKTLHVADSQTVQDFFSRCRQDGHCTGNYKDLALDLNDKLIREGSYEADRTLWHHSSWYLSKAYVVSLHYPRPQPNPSNYKNQLIDVQAPNGTIKQCSPNDSPAYFFRQCRNSGNCKDNAAMVLKFGNFEIKEDSESANRPFSSFDTDSGFAQVKKNNINH